MALAKLAAESRDYHRKGQANFRLSDDGVAALRTLANFYGLGMSAVVEMLARERVHEKRLNVSAFLKPAPRKKTKKSAR